MNRSDFRGSGGNQGCLAEPADEQFQGLIALFQIFRLYLGGVRVLIAGLPVGGVRTLGCFPGFIFQSLIQVFGDGGFGLHHDVHEPAAEGQSGQVIIQIAAGPQPVREQGLLNRSEPEFSGLQQIDAHAAGNNCLEKLVRLGGGQNEQTLAGRFLQGFQESVGGLVIHPLRIHEHGYLPFPLRRALLQKGFHGADIIPQDAARLGLGAHQPAILVPYTVQMVCPDAVYQLQQLQDQAGGSLVLVSHDEQGMGEPVAGEGGAQQVERLGCRKCHMLL